MKKRSLERRGAGPRPERPARLGKEPGVRAHSRRHDGARLSFMGLVCPNLGTGGYNYHGVFEYACVQEMQFAVEMLKKLVTERQ
jgi:tripeptide aminopeptidase